MNPLPNPIKIRRLIYKVKLLKKRLARIKHGPGIPKLKESIEARKKAIRYMQEYPLRSYTWEHLQEKFDFCYKM